MRRLYPVGLPQADRPLATPLRTLTFDATLRLWPKVSYAPFADTTTQRPRLTPMGRTSGIRRYAPLAALSSGMMMRL